MSIYFRHPEHFLALRIVFSGQYALDWTADHPNASIDMTYKDGVPAAIMDNCGRCRLLIGCLFRISFEARGR
jgi:hypothetical protein